MTQAVADDGLVEPVPDEDGGRMLTRRQKAQLALGAVIAAILTWWLSRAVHVPSYPGFSASLLGQPSPVLAIVLAFVVAAVGACVGALLCGGVRYDAPLFCAAVALSVLSFRGGSMRNVLLSATGRDVYLRLAIEVVLLFGAVLIAWLIQRALVGRLLRSEEHYDHLAVHPASPADGVRATGLGVAIMAGVCLILVQADDKAQAMIAVGAGAMLAATFARRLVPVGPVTWFAAIPIVTGVIGYVGTYLLDPSGWSLGQTRGMLAPLARPLPLDYASVGVACAVWGYWLGRHGQVEQLAAEMDEQAGA
jgi:hypothetical protein